jgi:hypothetical protein
VAGSARRQKIESREKLKMSPKFQKFRGKFKTTAERQAFRRKFDTATQQLKSSAEKLILSLKI